MGDEKLARIITSLLRKTKNGEIRWEETSSNSKFMVSFSRGNITIDLRTDEFGDEIVVIEIQNEYGKTAEEITASGVREWMQNSESVFLELYQLARRHALRIEEILDQLLLDLDDIPF